jgi:hypothetical protein
MLQLCRVKGIPGRRAPDGNSDLPHLSIDFSALAVNTIRTRRQNPGICTQRGEGRKQIALADIEAMPFEWMFVGDGLEFLVGWSGAIPTPPVLRMIKHMDSLTFESP